MTVQGLDLRHLEIFARVVREGGITPAARSLGLTQPTVSGHIQSLEKDAGVILLHRGGDVLVDRVRPVEERHKGFFPHAQCPQFLKDLAVSVVVLQPSVQFDERFLFFACRNICPAEIQEEHQPQKDSCGRQLRCIWRVPDQAIGNGIGKYIRGPTDGNAKAPIPGPAPVHYSR
jgi:DNA-binding transcriptional ArsR family regulator